MEIVKRLLDKGADINQTTADVSDMHYTVVVMWSLYGCSEQVDCSDVDGSGGSH